eukprot:10009624-Heterocapsa_arctica.AAC.1
MAKAYALAYGKAYEAPLLQYLHYLQSLHELDDHHWTFEFIANAWEELFWRQSVEVREAVTDLLRKLGKEN